MKQSIIVLLAAFSLASCHKKQVVPVRPADVPTVASVEKSAAPVATETPEILADREITGNPGKSEPETEEIDLGEARFAVNSAKLSKGDRKALEKMGRSLNADGSLSLTVAGHADVRGPADYNYRLGLRRAQSVKMFLVARGVSSNRISVVSFGESAPVCSEMTEDCHAKNRRARIIATK